MSSRKDFFNVHFTHYRQFYFEYYQYSVGEFVNSPYMKYQRGKPEGGDNLDQNVNVLNCFEMEGVSQRVRIPQVYAWFVKVTI